MGERLYHDILCPSLTKTGPCACQPVIIADGLFNERTELMSWSFQAVGKPQAVLHAIDTHPNNSQTGHSLTEWQEARPAIHALVAANVGNVAVRVNASGHGQFNAEGAKVSGQCSCTIESLYGFVE